MDNSNPTICLWITFDGGEGVVSVGQSCGSIRPTEKAKIGKGAKPPTPHYKKKGVGGFHKAGFGRNPTTKITHDADTLATNADKSSISLKYLL